MVRQVFGRGSARSSKERRLFFLPRFRGYHFMDLGEETHRQAKSGGERGSWGVGCTVCLACFFVCVGSWQCFQLCMGLSGLELHLQLRGSRMLSPRVYISCRQKKRSKLTLRSAASSMVGLERTALLSSLLAACVHVSA